MDIHAEDRGNSKQRDENNDNKESGFAGLFHGHAS